MIRSLAFIALCVGTLELNAQNVWLPVGTVGISAGTADFQSLALDASANPVVAYHDFANGGKTTVMRWNGASWNPVGSPGFSAGDATYQSLDLDASGNPVVAYRDAANGNKTTVMRWSGSAWSPVGTPGISTGAAAYQSLALNASGNPVVAYRDEAIGNKTTVMRWNGSAWNAVGAPGISAGESHYQSLALDVSGNPVVAYWDGGNGGKTTVLRWNGTAWNPVGTPGISVGFAFNQSLAVGSNGNPVVAYRDIANGSKTTVMRWSGSAWNAVGAPGISAGAAVSQSLALDAVGNPVVAYRDQANADKTTVLRWNGSAWYAVGSPGISAGYGNNPSLELDMNGNPFVSYADGANSNKITVLRWSGSQTQCNSTLTPTSAATTATASSGHQVGVSANAGCNWSAVSNTPGMITITAGASGSGNGNVVYSVSANLNQAQRTGTMTIAGQPFQVTQAGIASAVYTLSLYTQPSTGIALPEKHLRTVVSGSSLPAPVKICADGTKSTIVRVQVSGGSVNMSNIFFRMKSGSPDAARYCRFLSGDYEAPTSAEREALLTHPNYVSNSDSPFLKDTIEVYNSTAPNSTLVRIPVQIHRAPVTFVHGLWGDMDAFQNMDNAWISYFGSANIATYRVDYVMSNAEGFSTNSVVVPNGISSTIALARYRNFSCGAVDLVCHSMGGILSRIYLQSNHYRQDIHTLTTINTPNAGTQAADLLRSPWGSSISGVLGAMLMPVGQGAVDDMRSRSAYFEPCENLCNNLHVVPTLNFNSTSTQANWSSRDWKPFYVTFATNSGSFVNPVFGINVYGTYGLAQAIYEPDPGFDPIVPQTSQIGGLGSISRDEVTHMDAEKNQQTILDLRYSLGIDPNSAVFNHGTFQSVQLDVPWWIDAVFDYGSSSLVNGAVEILSPIDNANYTAGESVIVQLDNSIGDRHFLACVLGNDIEGSIGEMCTATPMLWTGTIPESMCGRIRVLGISIGSDGVVSYDSVFINVSVPSQLDSIRFTPNRWFMTEGESQRLNVLGYYSDGVIRNITDMTGLTFDFAEPTTVGPVGDHAALALEADTTFILAEMDGFTDTLFVEVSTSTVNYYHAAFRSESNRLCGEGSIQFHDVSGGTPVSRTWQLPGGSPSTSNDPNPLVQYATTGSHDVTLITTWVDKVDTMSVTGFISVGNPPTVEIDATDPTTIFQGDSAVLSAAGSNGVLHYVWSNQDTTQTVVVDSTGDYTVIAIDGLGCIATDLVSIVVNPLLKVSARAFLDGPYDVGQQMMRDSLRAQGMIPSTEPYSGLGYAQVGGGGGESVAPSVLAITGSNAIVDWVVLELRSSSNPAQVLQTRSALLQRDGDVVATDGVSPVGFSMAGGSYYVALRHRNHLGAMTSSAVVLSSTSAMVDFTSVSMPTYGTVARKSSGTKMLLWAGNTLWDNSLKYTGAGNDRDQILIRIGGTIPNNTVPGYYREDVNMDGVVKYTGSSNDKDPILVNVGGTTPNNTRTEQLP